MLQTVNLESFKLDKILSEKYNSKFVNIFKEAICRVSIDVFVS
jgi:hypothetical protein